MSKTNALFADQVERAAQRLIDEGVHEEEAWERANEEVGGRWALADGLAEALASALASQ